MLHKQLHPFHHHPPLTLIPSGPVTFVLFVAVFTTICLSNVNSKIITSPTSHLKIKSCSHSNECRDPHKECVAGKCECKPYFDYITERDLCVKSYGAFCSSFDSEEDGLCNQYKYLSCDDQGSCSCHTEGESLLIYDEHLETCAAPPGHHCELSEFPWSDVKKECVRNAKCVEDPQRKVDKDFFGVCECSNGFVGKGDKCLPELGATCELDGDCDQEGMECLEGSCGCARDRVYFERWHECKVKVGEICEVARGDCGDNAECQGRRDEKAQWEWRCTCNLGYQENKGNGTCEKDGYGNCGEGRIYDEERGRCSWKVGQGCKASGVNLCVKHGYCGTGNKCDCFEGYERTGNGTCERVVEGKRTGNGTGWEEMQNDGERREEIDTTSPEPYTLPQSGGGEGGKGRSDKFTKSGSGQKNMESKWVWVFVVVVTGGMFIKDR